DREIEPVERLLVDVARAAGADFFDPAAERVVEQIEPRARRRLVAEADVRDVRRLPLQRSPRTADVDARADEAQVAADRERGERAAPAQGAPAPGRWRRGSR